MANSVDNVVNNWINGVYWVFCYYLAVSFDHNQLGNTGERIAAEFLAGKGLSVIDANYSRKWGEIDIVAINDNQEVIFTEVKTMRCRVPEDVPQEGENKHRPEEKVGNEKKQRLRRIIRTYLEEQASGQPDWRVDLICIYFDSGRKRVNVNWLQNIII